MPTLTTTCATMAGGVNAIAGVGADTEFTFGGVWATDDTYSVILTDNTTAVQTLIGAGNITNIKPTFVFTFNSKSYLLAGSTVYFSKAGQPTAFNDITTSGADNGFVKMTNMYSSSEPLLAASVYQGRLAFFSRRTTQIWIIDANPANWQISQILQNIGTVASLSVQPLGDLDVMFLSDSGVRSLRERDSSLNAFVNDLGSPIDLLIQAAKGPGPNIIPNGAVYNQFGAYDLINVLQANSTLYTVTFGVNDASIDIPGGTPQDLNAPGTFQFVTPGTFNNDPAIFGVAGQPITAVIQQTTPFSIVSSACGVVEPTSNRYWIYFNGVIYVFSYFPSGKVEAWSTYTPQYFGADGVTSVGFTPVKFTIFQGQVYVRAGDTVLQYGGMTNAAYDVSVCKATLPWLDLGEPSVRKTASSIDYMINGSWLFQGSMDYIGVAQNNGSLLTINTDSQPSFESGAIPWSADGYHVQLSAQTTGATAATLSSIIFNYITDEPKL